VPLNPGDMRPRLNDRFGKVIRVANAAWVASGLNTGVRYSLSGWDQFEDQYMVYDEALFRYLSVSALYEQLPPNRRKAVWL